MGSWPGSDHLFRLLPGRFFEWPSEELGRIDLQDGRQLLDDLQAYVGDRPLDPAHVDPVDLGVVGQLLLRQFPLVPDPPKVGRKKLA